MLVVAIAFTAKVMAGDAFGREAPFLFLGVSVVGSGWVGGTRGALTATGLCVLGAWYFFSAPYHSFSIEPPAIARLAAFLVEGLAVTGIVTAMDKARRDAATSEGRANTIFESAVDSVVIMDASGRVVAVNAATVSAFGHERAALVGKKLSDVLIPERLREAHRDALARFRSTGVAPRVGKRLELEALHADGSEIPIELTITMSHAEGETLFTGYLRDVTQRRVDQQRLETLTELSAALAVALTGQEVARAIVENVRTAQRADTCTLYTRAESGKLELIGDHGVRAEVLEKIRTIDDASGNPVYDSLTTGEGLWVETAKAYDEIYPALARTGSPGPRAKAFWSMPLVVEGKPIGLLGMGFFEERTFSEEEREFIVTLTRQCAQALRRAQRLESEHRARELAETARASLDTTLRSIGDAVIATDAEGRVNFMNEVAERLTGWSAAEARAQPIKDVFHIVNESSRAEVESPVDKVLREGIVVGLANHTVLLPKGDAPEVPIDDSGAPIRSAAGEVQGVVLVFRDVTAKKKEEARRAFLADATSTLASSLDYRATLAAVADLVVPTLADWCAVDVLEDPAAGPKRLAVAHVDRAKVDFAHELATRYPDDPSSTTGLHNVLRTGRSELYKDIPEALLIAGAKDAEHLRIIRELQLRSAMIVPLIARGRTVGALSFVHAESGRSYNEEDLAFAEDLGRRAAVAVDNAQLYAAEQRARDQADVANRAKDEFLSTVSHELRTPLNAILGWSRMMATATFTEERRARAMETIERNATAMAELVEDLLDVSRIISGRLRLDVHPVEVARIVEAALESVRPSVEAKEIRLHTVLAHDAGPIAGDPGRIQQIAWNLLSNAVKFTPKGGRIEVIVRRVGSSIELSVTDSGQGIPASFLPFVFDPFRQADSTITRSRGGLGLGLAITKQLVELHGGLIEAKSAGEGRGASFVVSLPVSAMRHARAGESLAAMPVGSQFDRPAALRNLRVLVVDDEPDARQLVASVLEACGSIVTLAANARAAMESIQQSIPDLLVSDIGMPEEDGYALIRKVRALPVEKGGNIPAAALTAYARAEDRRKALTAGFMMHIPKPVEPAELVAVVASLARLGRPSKAEKPESGN
ncbi:MAG: two-component hybrid sensor and regulator, partial [Myxococcaceae bacterium]|nr:two-component hybrid sensor and regulator [Myxococcaceae bacterium]